jgi:heme o synthase
MVGYAMAPGSFDIATFLIVSLGTGGTICAANSINQIIEVSNDSRMNRTKKRYLPTKKITVLHAKCFAGVCAVSGVGSLLFLNPLTAGLALFNLGLYTAVYTPMKQKNPANTWIGAIVGAIPPMIGWAACTGGAEMGSWVIGTLLAFWQMPHFMALSYSLKDDYHRGGFKMLINTHPEKVPGVITRYSLALLPIGYLSYLSGMTSGLFALDYLIPSGYLTFLAYKFSRNPDKQTARQIFKYTLLFLPLVMLLMMVHKIYRPLPASTLASESEQTSAPVS